MRNSGEDFEELMEEALSIPEVREYINMCDKWGDVFSKDQLKYLNIVKECIVDNSDFSEEMVDLIIKKSSFKELLPENEQFIGHYPPEYWAKYILDEYIETVKVALKTIDSI